MPFRLTVRSGPSIARERFDSLDEALGALEAHCRALAAGTRRATARTIVGTFDPVQQVAARAEVRGPGVKAGVDVRGDGSTEAFVGGLRRRVVERRERESAYDALRRALTA